MKIAVVVQRYGEDVAGGAELHARHVAELLAGPHRVTVLTTTARDYLTWANHYPAGRGTLNGVEVVRFEVERQRDLEAFAAASVRAFHPDHDDADEQAFFESQGPLAPALWQHLESAPDAYDVVIAFSFRYITTWRAAMATPDRTLLVPTAEDDPTVSLRTVGHLFRSVRAIAYNTSEERSMIVASSGNHDVHGDIVGVFSRIPAATDPARFRQEHGVSRPYLLYVGRIDRNKGCAELFSYFAAWSAETGNPHDLLLVGRTAMDLPNHPQIRHLGFISEASKYDAIAGADALLVPSPFESLSMVTLEAMALGVPPIVNGNCAVLRGQVRRSGGGLYYQGYEEFFESLDLLVRSERLRRILGRNGQKYYAEHYAEPVIAAKLDRLLAWITEQRRHTT